jgi:F-type H+-transporting ATPase subunit b
MKRNQSGVLRCAIWWSALGILAFFVTAAVLARAQESSSHARETTSAGGQTQKTQGQEPQPQSPHEAKRSEHPGTGAELAKETREAAGEGGDTEQFKTSASVRMLAKLTGGNLQHAYWLAVLLNFVVIAAGVAWAGRKYLSGMFRDRTASIQRAMEEARRASEDANRRLAEIESRLSKLGGEIAAMKAAGEADLAAEESRIKAAAEEDGRKIVESAEQEIAAAAKAARRDLTTYAADLAVALAKRQIHVDAGIDASLVRSFSERLAGADGSGKDKN